MLAVASPRTVLSRDDVAIAGATVVVGGAAIAGATATSETGPILAFVGVLMVALITVYAANRRQQQELVAERERLDARLHHEREQADLADLRAVLGESLAAANRARQATIDALSDRTKYEDARRALTEMETSLDRVHVRLGEQERSEGISENGERGARVASASPGGAASYDHRPRASRLGRGVPRVRGPGASSCRFAR